MSLLSSLKAQKEAQRQADIDRALIHYEAKIGGELFGPVAKGNRREFFCLDKHTWVWHEESVDANGQLHVTTTRYDVRPSGILKSQGGQSYQKLMGVEAQNFYQAVEQYEQRVSAAYTRMLQTA